MPRKPSATRRTAPARKAAPKRHLVVKAVGDMGAADSDLLVGTIADGNSQRLPNAEQYWHLYEAHPWVRACVRIIANAVAQEGFTVAKVDGEDYSPVTSKDDKRVGEIHQFFRGAFNGKTFRHVVKTLAIDLEVFGKGYWRKRRQGDLLWYERLDPRLIVPKLNAEKTEIEAFQLKRVAVNETGIVIDQTQVATIPADEVIMFSLEGGDVVLGAPSPLEALDLTIAIDLNVRKHRNSYFSNGAVGGTVLINKEADEDQVRAAEKQFRSMKTGARNAYKTWILTGDWDVKKTTDAGKQDVDFVKGTEIAREEICAVYSVPAGKLINVQGAMGQAGKGEDDETFEQECVLPLEELIYETLTSEILLAEFEIDDLALVPKRRAKIRTDMFEAAVNLVKFGGTGNEARQLVSLPPYTYDSAKDDPEKKKIADGMDVPLFVTVKGQSLVDDSADASASEPDGELGKTNDANQQDAKQKNEVARKGAADFRKAEVRLQQQLHALTKREAARLNAVWDRIAGQLHAIAAQRYGKDAAKAEPDPFAGLADEMVLEDVYAEAVGLGIDAAPGEADAESIVQTWVGRLRKYADRAQANASDAFDAALEENAPSESLSVEDALANIDAKIEALRSSITRYAEPPWGAGMNGYGDGLRDANILMVWELDSADPCPDCIDFAAGSPYEVLPSWPGAGDSVCLDRCKCRIVADQESWDASLGD